MEKINEIVTTIKPYCLSSKEVLKLLGSSRKGLTSDEVRHRQSIFPPNVLKGKKPPTKFEIFINQFKDILVIILLISAVISVIIHHNFQDAIMIAVILIVNAVFGTWQEFKADRAIQALQQMTALTCEVIRDNQVKTIDTKDIVPGDIIRLDPGKIVPADGRLIEAVNLRTIESSLTGESTEVAKFVLPKFKEDANIADLSNMVFKGTHVSNGRGLAVVTATGMDTEFGKIAALVSEVETEQTPIQEKLDQVGTQLGYITILISIAVAILGMLAGGKLEDMILLGVSLAVAAIPEGLPIVVTISLALGVQKMAKRNAIVRKLPSVESLGAASVICTDKTGTLTINQMTVRKIARFSKNEDFDLTDPKLISNDPVKDELFLSGVLCNNASLEVTTDGTINQVGDPTEISFLLVAHKLGYNLDVVKQRFLKLDEIPFDSSRKRMTTIHEDLFNPGKFYAFTKGAPDVLLELCNYYEAGDEIKPLTPEIIDIINNTLNDMADHALRVLAFAKKPMEEGRRVWNINELENDLVFIGLQGLIDPPRPEVFDAVQKCKSAGVKIVMATGDHKRTAAAIGRELSISNDLNRVMDGKMLDTISDTELAKIVDQYDIFARINPAHKLKIVQAYKAQGKIVAMTGDGINDAPALKAADIGVAMGITGTDVTKETSDIVLMDDNFATIVAAIEEGRGVYQSMGKFLKYMLSSNSAEILVIAIAILLGLPAPYMPVQILWINLVTDGLPALALGVDPPERGLMKKPPRDPNENILNKQKILFIIRIGLYMTVATLGLYLYNMDFTFTNYTHDPVKYVHASTMTFATISIIQLFNSFGARSEYHSVLGKDLISNKALIYATIVSAISLIAVVQGDLWFSFILNKNITFFSNVFYVTPLGIIDWIIIFIIGFSILLFDEIFKYLNRRALQREIGENIDD